MASEFFGSNRLYQIFMRFHEGGGDQQERREESKEREKMEKGRVRNRKAKKKPWKSQKHQINGV